VICAVIIAIPNILFLKDRGWKEIRFWRKSKSIRPSLVEITGGEPLLQYGTPDLAKQLLERNYTVLIETSGSQDLLRLDPAVVKICDVKTPSSGEVDRFFWKNLETFTARDQLKFVIGNREDFDFSVAWLKAYPVPCELLFSPVYRELEPSLLASWILQEGLAVRLQIQLHKFLWPSAKRGV
jgi:7-carboxy-7-deazaguanine synthase